MSVRPASLLVRVALAWLLCGPLLGCSRAPSGGGEASWEGGEAPLTLMLRGDPTGAHGTFAKLFKERYQGRVEYVGHHLPAAREKEIEAHNRRAAAEIARRHGPGRLEELCREAGLPMRVILRE
jgi:hypothetical protein